jgi:lysophospholipase L1-like esterase
MRPVIESVTGVNGEIAPAPLLPRWIAYGDAVTQGWIASGPAQGWAAIAARKTGLDLCNLGYAAAGCGELASAEYIASLEADVISIAYGASCWTRNPHSIGMMTEGFSSFLEIVRQGHPTTPVVVISPFLRPDAEGIPNRLGASLSELRRAIETTTRDRIVAGDAALHLLMGGSIVSEEHLGDGIHPDDEGHRRIAAAASKALPAAMHPPEEARKPSAVRSSVKPPRMTEFNKTTSIDEYRSRNAWAGSSTTPA